MSELKSTTKETRDFLDEIFDVPNSQEKETSFFKDKSHGDLLSVFGAWFRLVTQLNGSIVNNLNIHGWHDRGIDLIMELSGKINTRIGIQIKCDSDFDEKLNIQVDNTLANYDTYNIDYVIFIFCGDYTNLSHKAKILQEVARIQQKSSVDKLLLIEAPKALSLLKDIMPISVYLDQFKAIPKNKKFSMRITGFDEHDSGFPIVNIESDAFINNDESVHLAKAYLLTIIGLVNSDILELGFYGYNGIVIGTCPIDKTWGVIINDQFLIKVPMWFIRGLEEHRHIDLWGSGAHNGGKVLKLFLQFQITKTDFEKNRHYQFVKNKFVAIVNRMKQLGEIIIEP